MTESAPILSLGFSPCPNDTFIFNGIVNGPVEIDGYRVEAHLHDVERLNTMAFNSRLDVTKLSFYAWLKVKSQYRLLSSGGAMGFGCGPVVVARRPMTRDDMATARVVLPGEWTTAHLLFRLWAPMASRRQFVPYDAIFDALRTGAADCGVIIHESRFTFEAHGFQAVADLGQWWETRTGLPIPLGCIAVHKRFLESLDAMLDNAIRQSIALARQSPEATLPYIKTHAQEMTPDVLRAHIDTFVNDYSLDFGALGMQAIHTLEKEAMQIGVIP